MKFEVEITTGQEMVELLEKIDVQEVNRVRKENERRKEERDQRRSIAKNSQRSRTGWYSGADEIVSRGKQVAKRLTDQV